MKLRKRASHLQQKQIFKFIWFNFAFVFNTLEMRYFRTSEQRFISKLLSQSKWSRTASQIVNHEAKNPLGTKENNVYCSNTNKEQGLMGGGTEAGGWV